MARRLLVGLSLIVPVLWLAACAPPTGGAVRSRVPSGHVSEVPTSTPKPAPLQLIDTGWRWVPVEDNVAFAYVLKNPHDDLGAKGATLLITMFDADGTVIATDDLPVWPIRPGETIAGGSSTTMDFKPARVAFSLVTDDQGWVAASRWTPIDFKPLAVVDLKLKRVEGKPDPDQVGFVSRHSYFSGYVQNPNSVGFGTFAVEVLQRNRFGALVADYTWFSDIDADCLHITPGGRVAFRLDVPDRLPPDDTYEASARPWYDMDAKLPYR